ncbi:amino acid adenylation domain-containing protein [Streptomyces sp. NPDC017638]|uniref:amino acid adenylation domain-containing protein n=1 Tax=Streptomyces sp. NPDC017638 TaxID=3365004 RepID=UPI003789ADEE
MTSAPAPATAPPARTHEVSVTQHGLWFLDQITPGDPLYTLAWRIDLDGPLDTTALHHAVNAVVARHDALRTRFARTGDGRPVQLVTDRLTIALPVTDLRPLPAAERDRAAADTCAAEAATGFDLSAGPLIRTRLLRTEDHRHTLVLLVHHIVFDAVSMEAVVRELADAYGHARAGTDWQPTPTAQYPDFADRQRTELSGPRLERLLAFWRRELQGAPELLTLPTDRPRPAEQTHAGGEHRLRLPTALTGRLRALARRERVTLHMLLLAAYQVLLARWSGQRDVSVGTTVAGRPHTELAAAVGYFVNMVVLRGRLEDNPSFRDHLRAVRTTCLRAYDHQALPFDRVVEELRPGRSLSHNPLFQVTFDTHVDERAHRTDAFGEARLTGVDFIEAGRSKFDLSLTAVDDGTGVEFTAEYATDLFDHATIERFTGHYALLLEAAAEAPDTPVDGLGFLSAEEETLTVRDWNRTDGPVPDTTLGDLFAAQAARTPGAVAVSDAVGSLTYAQLDARAAQVANLLRSRGHGPETTVGVFLERSTDLVVALYGVVKSGAAFVPLDPGYPPDRLAHVVDDAGITTVLTESALRPRLPGRLDAPALDTDRSLFDAQPTTAPRPAVTGRHLAYLVYTSGSTGRPKGAMNEHRNIVNQLTWVQDRYGLDADDVLLQKTPVGFDDSLRELFWPLAVGARLVMAEPGAHRDPASLADVIEAERVTVLHVVPSLLQAFVEAPADAARCASLRRVVCSGEALLPELQRRFFATFTGTALSNLYGPCEAAIDVTHWDCLPGAEGPVPIGGPVLNTRVHVLDAAGRPVPIGVPGELHVAGRQIGRGYHGKPALTAERFVPDPFSAEPGSRLYRTGDVCRWRADGRLDYLGRTDHQVKIRGIRIEPEEIDAALTALPQVRQAAVLCREDTPGDKRLVAYVVPAAEVRPADLRTALTRTLPAYMVPGDYVLLDALPLNSNGKLDRAALPAPAGDRPGDCLYTAPRDDVEAVTAWVWADVLGLERVGIHDDFFDLGGHSLLATRAVMFLREHLGADLRVHALFRAPTPALLAAEALRLAADPQRLRATSAAVRAVLDLTDDEADRLLDHGPAAREGAADHGQAG